jgi:hypothetical protein
MVRWVFWAMLGMVLGCSGDDAGAGLGDATAATDTDLPDAGADIGGGVRLNHLQLKGTHNSYHLPPDELVVPEWDYAHAPLDVQLEDLGVRQVEIDVHWLPEEGFRVYHIPLLDDRSTCATLQECLGILKSWSDEHPGHIPLFVLIEPKDDIDPHKITGHYDDLDAELLAAWPRARIITPDDVRGTHPDLRTALAAEGWPLLRDSRGKVLFQMLDSGEHRDAYLAPDPTLAGRVMFVRGGPDEPWGSMVEIGSAVGREDEVRTLVEQGYMVRSTADSTDPEDAATNPARAQAALDAGSHLISTDFPAPVEGGYWFTLPGGGPGRCNPVSAPPECVDGALE